MKIKHLKKFSTLLLVSSILLSGCGIQNNVKDTNNSEVGLTESSEASTGDVAASEKSNENSDKTYPIVINHAFGQTILENKPERIATISWGNHDTPLALGIVPVGISKANYGVTDDSGLLPWTLEKFHELGIESPVLYDDLAGVNYEAIADSEPDVILAAYSGLTQEEYDLLTEIAPVVAYPQLPWQTYWRDQIIIDAMGMGLEDQGRALVSELESLIDKKISEYPQIQGKKAAFFYFNPSDLGSFYVYLPADPRAAYLTDLGMDFPESITRLAKNESSFAISISAENADQLNDVDIILTYGSETLLSVLQADSLLNKIPAIQRGAVAIIPDNTPLAASGTPTALSIPATIDDYLKLIGEAVDIDQ